MSQQELLARVIGVLDDLGIENMVTGALASSMQGAPRLTHDIDIVVDLDETSAQGLFEKFSSEEFYLEEKSIYEAMEQGGMFNLIDINEGLKVDFWVLTDEPFDRSRFSRRLTEEVLGIKLRVSSPEDTILQKLKWAKLSGGSEKQLLDALQVYEVQFEKLEMDYLRYWARELGVEPLLKRIENESTTAP
ncbi:MAG: hypothetical protein PHP64_01360 [Actinomycetota bacterium]|nr:hypothetical protein [Actinomycetota bacterium]